MRIIQSIATTAFRKDILSRLTTRSPMRYLLFLLSLAIVAELTFSQLASATPLTQEYKSYDLTSKFKVLQTPTSGKHTGEVQYNRSGYVGMVSLSQIIDDTYDPMYHRSPYQTLQDLFKKEFGKSGWSIKISEKPLSNDSLIVRTYDASDVDTQNNSRFAVGAEFHLQYVPHGTDPAMDLHWIQFVAEWVAIGTPKEMKRIFIDNGGTTVPYYDAIGTADSSDFYDFPVQPDDNALFNHIWHAYTFLVSGDNKPGDVTFYGGVEWGWTNVYPLPEPSSSVILIACLALLFIILGVQKIQCLPPICIRLVKFGSANDPN